MKKIKGFTQHHFYALRLCFKENRFMKSGAGFTLIELLIVVAIIGILAALLMVNFIGVRERGRDSQRKSDLKQIQSALELYRTDNNVYPTTAIFSALACGASFKSPSGLTTYMQKLPCDPLGGLYTYTSDDGTTYSLYACLENTSDAQRDGDDGSANDQCSAVAGRVSLTVQNP